MYLGKIVRLINKVDPATIEVLKGWCRARVNQTNLDVSNYARGRRNLWLFNEVHLGNGKVSKGYFDDRIYQFSQRVYPGCDIGLFTFAGEFGDISSNGLIKQHRDHGYAQPTAVIVNLGECIFGYENEKYKLSDGSIIEFNCKKLHSVDQILSPERFSLVFWKLNQRKGYHSAI